jgi:hypothetical protein
MQRFRQHNKVMLDADRARALLEAVRRRMMRDQTSHGELKAELFKAFTRFFTELSMPITEVLELRPRSIRDPEDYSELLESAESDIKSGTDDAKNLSESIVAAFNLAATQMEQLDSKVKRVTSKSQDLQHLSDTFAEDAIVAGDDFADDSKMDLNAVLEVPMVEMPHNQNTVMLRRNEARNLLEDQKATIRILSTFRLYEGAFYALEGQARPEGGLFHFAGPDNSTQNDIIGPGVSPDLMRRYSSWRSDPTLPESVQTPDGKLRRSEITASMAVAWASKSEGGRWGPFTQNEWDMLANNYHTDDAFVGNDKRLMNPRKREVEYDKGAPLEDRQTARMRMIDGNPDSFWECEYVIDSGEAILNLMNGEINPDGTPNKSAGGTPNESGTPPAEGGDTGPQVSLGDLLRIIAGPAVDRYDFDVTIVIELPNIEIVNWVNLIPHNFSPTSWMEVVDLATSADGAEWESIEGLHDGKYENILTDEANSELTDEEISVTMSPNKFQYTGQGVWTFPSREARYIRLSLLQKTPVPAPYDVIQVEMSQTVTTTRTSSKKGLLGDIIDLF